MTVIVFDIGNVLVHWNPACAFRHHLGSEAEVEAFLERTDFFARNLRADGGERFDALAREIEDPADRALFSSYVDRYAMTITHPIEGTWQILDRLRRRGHPVHAITNWSAETWPIGLTLHPRLLDAFGVTLVSGMVRLTKPRREIFELFCRKVRVPAERCLFIDDSPDNIAGARAVGMEGLLFTGVEDLDAALTARRLL